MIIGSNNTVNQGHEYTLVSGRYLTTTKGYQTVLGISNDATATDDDVVVVGGGNFEAPGSANRKERNIFTIPRTSVQATNSDGKWYSKPSKSSDAITYGYLQEALLNGAW